MFNDFKTTSVSNQTSHKIEDLLSSKQLSDIIEFCTRTHRYYVEKLILKKATEGLAGYLGDHLRLSILVKINGRLQEINLFIKCLPKNNQPKTDFIKSNGFYKREQFVFNELLKKAGAIDDRNPWRPEALICNEELVVMPDLSVSGYRMRDKSLYFDLRHCLVTLSAVARYHAACVDYETEKRRLYRHYTIPDEFGDILEECNFKDCPWLRAGAKTTARFLGTLSKIYHYDSDRYKEIEPNLERAFIAACDTIKQDEGTVNVIVHKDLWANNVMFKYEGETPVNAVLLDFQCVRYAPPAFDLTTFLYLNTSRPFRAAHEMQLLAHYHESFVRALSEASRGRLEGYTLQSMLARVESARAFGALVAAMLFPYVLMDAVSAQRTFDDAATYERYNNVDRSEPVLAQAAADPVYRDKILEVSEEFAEKFVLGSPPAFGSR